MIRVTALVTDPSGNRVGFARQILDLVADLGWFAQGLHDSAPLLVVAAIPPIVNVGEYVGAFMEQCGVAVGLTPGEQKSAVENNAPLVGISDAGLGFGAPAGLDRGGEASMICVPQGSGGKQARTQRPLLGQLCYRANFA